MEKKLQELTEKIYSEGVEKAKAEAEKILAGARKVADAELTKANKQSEQILAEAKKRSDEMIRNGQSEMKLAVNQALTEVKQKLTEIVTLKTVTGSVAQAVTDKDFMKKVIETSVKNFFADQSKGMDVELILPESMKNDLGVYFKSNAKSLLDGGLELKFDPSVETGFKIGPADGGYRMSFTDKDFENFFKKYMKPKTIELLFGGK
jgi:V/A-type H+/Na+-transporting ATPase subunit E